MIDAKFRAARGAKILVVGPLARFAIHKYCEEAGHVTNSEDQGFVAGIKDKLLTLGKNLKNLIHLRRLKDVKVLNPAVLTGLTTASEDGLMHIWGRDPSTPLSPPTRTWLPTSWTRSTLTLSSTPDYPAAAPSTTSPTLEHSSRAPSACLPGRTG